MKTIKKNIKILLSFLLNPVSMLRIKHGSNVIIGRGLKINGKGKVIYIGDNTSIGRFARLGNAKNLIIDHNCDIGTNFTALGDIEIKYGNLIASYVSIIATRHAMNPDSLYGYMSHVGETNKKITIERSCWIGEKAIILPGVTIGEKSIIGAGSVVTKNIPPYSMAVGNPAKVIKKFNSELGFWENV